MILADFPKFQKPINDNRKKYSSSKGKNHSVYQQIDIPIYEKTITDYLTQLDIENILPVYQKQKKFEQDIERKKTRKITNQIIKNSVNKLHNQILKRNLINQIIEPQVQKQQPYKFNDFAHLEQNYGNKFLISVVEKKVRDTYDNLFKKFNKKFIFDSQTKEMFFKSLVFFFLSDIQHNYEKQDELSLQYSNYLNKITKDQFKRTLNRQQFPRNQIQHLQKIAKMLPFLYSSLNINNLKKDELEIINCQKKLFQWMLNNSTQTADYSLVFTAFSHKIDNKFTIPYTTDLYQVKKDVIKEDASEAFMLNIEKLKAKPIPESTYHQPKAQKKEKKSPTKPVEFNFIQNHRQPKLNADDLYNFNRVFQAKPTPASTYTPELIELAKTGSNFRQQRSQNLLKTSFFPSTMKYLQNYKEVQKQKTLELAQKHSKKQGKLKKKEIPNFNLLHQIATRQLQTRKQLNKTATQSTPFNLSSPKKLTPTDPITFFAAEALNEKNVPRKKRAISSQQNFIQAKSTAKFDAYIQLRKQQRQSKVKEIAERELMQKTKQQNLKQYKNILKQRLQYQLKGQTKPKKYNNQQIQETKPLKVDLEQIYQERPLLMSTKKGKIQSQQHTDEYKPII